MRGSTKAQVQMLEIVVVLIVFFMLIGFGVLFFTKYVGTQAKQDMSYTQSLELAERAKILASIPELRCSLRGDVDFVCLDEYRIEAFNKKIQEPDNIRHYADTFSGYKATVTCVYPPTCSHINGIEIFNYLPRNVENTVPFILPINIYDPMTREYYYGELELTQGS